jgi:hypothetical protein
VVFKIKKRTQAEGVQKQGAEEDIWHNRGEVTAGWRTLHHEERKDLYRSPNIIREMGGTRCMNGEERCTCGFVESPVGSRPLPRPSGRWEDIIKMYLK